MTQKGNKNLFGMTVTALDDTVVSCAHMEPKAGGPLYPRSNEIGKILNSVIESIITNLS